MTSPPPEIHLKPARLSGRLLAEAVRCYEADGADLLPEEPADVVARTGVTRRGADAGGLEDRIVARADGLAIASKLRGALRRVHAVTGWIIGLIVLLAALAGAAAARAALGGEGDDPINVFWVVGGLLGAQTLLIVGWILVILLRPRAINVSPIGGAVLAGARWLAGRGHRSPVQLAAIRAVGEGYARGPIGRWTLSSVSHAVWAAFNIGCLALLAALLSAKQYVFTWETTILDGAAYERITRWLAVAPDAMGFITPDVDDVRRSGPGASPEDLAAAKGAWSGLLVGAIAAYGLAPRLLLLVLCELRRRIACRRYRLDLADPGYVRLHDRLMPAAEREGVVDGDDAGADAPPLEVPAPSAGVGVIATPDGGPPAIVGLEIEPPQSSWPPQLHGVRWTDLGFVESRDDRRRALRALRELGELAETPRVTVVVCSLTTTPDRGLAGFLGEIVGGAGGPVALLLTSGDAMRRRGDGDALVRRVDDWRRLAATSGVAAPAVIELDLDHWTEASLGRLAGVLGLSGASAGPPSGRRLEPACDLIVAAVASWTAPPDMRSRARLHRQIAELYRAATGAWRDRFRLSIDHPGDLEADLVQRVTGGVDHVVGLLPPRLKASPRWLAAGAASGALGCVAAAMLLSPAAISALPLWSAIGAAVAAAAQPSRGEKEDETSGSPAGDAGEAVRAAALFALLLEMQGRDEATISAVLDRTLDVDDAVLLAPGDERATRDWLDETRHRLDLALTEIAGESGGLSSGGLSSGGGA